MPVCMSLPRKTEFIRKPYGGGGGEVYSLVCSNGEIDYLWFYHVPTIMEANKVESVYCEGRFVCELMVPRPRSRHVFIGDSSACTGCLRVLSRTRSRCSFKMALQETFLWMDHISPVTCP